MKKRILWWALLLVALLINTLILINRNNGYKYYPYKTYSELYTTDSSQCFKDIYISGDLLQLRFLLPLKQTEWKLYTDSLYTSGIKSGDNELAFPLKSGLHN